MRLGSNAKVDLLKQVPLFSGCSKTELEALAGIADEIDLRRLDRCSPARGSRGREFFVLVDGTVDVTQGGEEDRRARAPATGSARSRSSRRRPARRR